MNDPEFDQLLRATKNTPLWSPSFHQEVWLRIENAETESLPEIAKFPPIISAFERPWGAVAGIAAMVTLGLWLGATTAPETEDPQVAYAESISPFAHTRGK